MKKVNSSSSSKQSSSPSEAQKPPESWRDTFEQIVLAFVLALVFRTFEAEAFVIPTGSMAPTLYGRNKEMNCTQCGHPIVVGASSEVTKDGGLLKAGVRITGAVCPNCRYPNEQMREARVFNGDRILVNKFPYALGEPKFGDVFVFKFPESPETNFIKRLVGLPGQKLLIQWGDLFLVDEDRSLKIRRLEDPNKQNAIQILVHDNEYQSPALVEAGWPSRWVARVRDAEREGWKDVDQGWRPNLEDNSFTFEPKEQPDQKIWLRYRHVVPTVQDWDDIEQGRPITPQERLISDFCGYNAVWGEDSHLGHRRSIESSRPENVETGSFWVGDLTVDFTVELSELGQQSQLEIELCEGPWWYRCRIDLQSGQASLYEIDTVDTKEREVEMATAETDLAGDGEYEICFANVDDRVCLWIDGDLVEFGSAAEYSHTGPTSLPHRPQWSDLSPIGISVQSAKATVDNLRVRRDIYYIGNENSDWGGDRLSTLLTDPEAWYAEYKMVRNTKDLLELDVPDHAYLAMGDNSPRSHDSRSWRLMKSVPRKYLVGKAFWIYWPHGVPILNDGRGYGIVNHKTTEIDPTTGKRETAEDYPRYSIPFYPNIGRMKRIR